MPSLKEQEAVAWYVLERPLVRPNTSYRKAAFYVSLFLAVNSGITILLYYLFRWLGVSSFLPQVIWAFYSEHHIAFVILLTLLQFLVGGIIVLKPMMIGAIRLYQRYAPESVRRRCLFKPTCSEYAILAINTKIKSVTSEYMIKKQISFLEISSYLDELSAAFKDAINDEFERFGVEVVNFYCEAITPRTEDYEKLRHYKEELALGEGFYQRRRSLDIAERLASNPATAGIANAGIGLGMGLGTAGQFGSLMAGIGQNVQMDTPDKEIRCPKCGAKNNASMKFCGSCGAKLASTIVCPHCGKEIPAGTKFCGECGKPLGKTKCPACGTENEPGMKFCGNCGEKLQ